MVSLRRRATKIEFPEIVFSVGSLAKPGYAIRLNFSLIINTKSPKSLSLLKRYITYRKLKM